MAATRIFRLGNSQFVCLPENCRFNSVEVEIFRRGDDVVLRNKPKSLLRVIELVGQLPAPDREDAPPQEREGL